MGRMDRMDGVVIPLRLQQLPIKVRIETLCMNIINFVVLLVRDDISICYPYHYCYCHYYSFLVKRCAWCAVGLVGASIDKLPRAVGKVVDGGGGWGLEALTWLARPLCPTPPSVLR